MIIFPAIDIKGGKCVRLLKGSFNKVTEYKKSPLDRAKEFIRLGFYNVHIVDLDGAQKENPINENLIEEISKIKKIKIQVGGGIRSLERIKKDTLLFMIKKKDQYAKGQEILYLFSRDDETLLNHIKNNKELLRNYFEKKIIQSTSKKIFSKKQHNISRDLLDKFGYSISIPYAFNLAKSGSNFVWLREIDLEYEKNIFIYYENYTSEKIFFDKNIKVLRKKIVEKNLRDIEKPTIYMSYQEELPFQIKEINFNDNYAIETRGLWKLSDISSGGPFLSYTFVDKKINRLYYIEGYVYAPGMKKRNLMREIYSILWSFKLKN